VHPNSGEDNGADAVIDTASHEVNEAITDPIGSQCDEEAGELVGCEHGAWTDAIGQEIADKCLPPEVPVAGIYGPPLGGVNPQFYNQLINGDHYFTQREWSNEAGTFEGACVQRAIGASFTVSAAPAATVPTTFDGSPSGAPGDRAVYWVWNFEGEQIGTSSPATSHAFASAGEKRVTLTAFDAFGNAEATSQRVLIGPAPPPPPPPKREVETIFSTTTTTTATSLPAVERLTLAQLARALGLPAEGATLSGAGALSLGRATCPPACALTVQIFARTSTTKRGHRSSSNTLVGSAKVTIAAKSAKVVSVSLNARGKSLLRRLGKLKVSVKVAIEDAQGATWQLTRSLTIKGAAKGKRARR
jgi:hypothetical protein